MPSVPSGSIDVEFVLMPGTKDEPTAEEVKENLKNMVLADKLAVTMEDQTEARAIADSFDTFDPEGNGTTPEPGEPVDNGENFVK